jgi:tetrahydromethanopterin S-methyltransferase subunit G
VQGFEERAVRLESDIRDSQKRSAELETKVGSAFEKEDRYHHLVKRQSEIEEKLDLTKNQAPVQAESGADNENEERISPAQVQTKSHRQTRKLAACV